MFKLIGRKAVVSKADSGRASKTLLLPSGEHVVVLDGRSFRRALHAADLQFKKAAKDLKVKREREQSEFAEV
jgi:adenylylsulfate kinase-like enzyme